MNRSNNRNSEDEEEDQGNSWATVATVGAGLAAVAGGLYWWATRSSEPEGRIESQRKSASVQLAHSSIMYPRLNDMMDRISLSDNRIRHQARGTPRDSIPTDPDINNLDSLLHDIYRRYIALNDDEFRHHYRVFDSIFLQMHRTMQRVDPYYRQYSSTVQIAGSHYDRLRINKPDEFDVDIFIGLPLNIRMDPFDASRSDVILEPMKAGYVQLKMGTQFQKLPERDGWEVNRTLYSWRDNDNYLLRSKFTDWFKSLVYRALNEFGNDKTCFVDNVPYTIHTSEAGPAITLKIKSLRMNFKMDVDLVPVLKFPQDRWPVSDGYRKIAEDYRHEIFMVVPKPMKGEFGANAASRSWRMSLIYQERAILHDTYNLRQIIRLLKKLRDTLHMDYVASYYIKTLFFWEVYERQDPGFWRQSESKLFIIMVKKLHAALSQRRIPYFWNDKYNLIEGAAANIVAGHVAKLAKLLQILDNPSEYKKVATFLLTPSEYAEYSRFL